MTEFLWKLLSKTWTFPIYHQSKFLTSSNKKYHFQKSEHVIKNVRLHELYRNGFRLAPLVGTFILISSLIKSAKKGSCPNFKPPSQRQFRPLILRKKICTIFMVAAFFEPNFPILDAPTSVQLRYLSCFTFCCVSLLHTFCIRRTRSANPFAGVFASHWTLLYKRFCTSRLGWFSFLL